MSSYAPPPGPPPPKVPEGWKAQFNEQYHEWFYVNLITEKSQWEVPTAPARGEGPSPVPPSYSPGSNPALAATAGDRKVSPAANQPPQPEKPMLQSNNPYANSTAHSSDGAGTKAPAASNIDDDARLAAQLQAEEDARAAQHPHQNQNPYQQPQPHSAEKQRSSGASGGFLGKLFHKKPGSSGHGQQFPTYGPQPGYPAYPPQPGYPPYGGHYPSPHHGRQGHGGGGMGMAGAAALGIGGGLLGGALLAEAIDDHNDYDDGMGDDGGGDFGGGDF